MIAFCEHIEQGFFGKFPKVLVEKFFLEASEPLEVFLVLGFLEKVIIVEGFEEEFFVIVSGLFAEGKFPELIFLLFGNFKCFRGFLEKFSNFTAEAGISL